MLAKISITDSRHQFTVGETVTGKVDLLQPEGVQIKQPKHLQISYVCLGEVQWTEYITTGHFVNEQQCHNAVEYHREQLKFWSSADGFLELPISFSFVIPRE